MTLDQHGEIKEYVCHVGHRLGLQSMIADKTDVIERTMWTALAQSEELVALLEQAQDDGQPTLLGPGETEIAMRRDTIRKLREMLEKSVPAKD